MPTYDDAKVLVNLLRRNDSRLFGAGDFAYVRCRELEDISKAAIIFRGLDLQFRVDDSEWPEAPAPLALLKYKINKAIAPEEDIKRCARGLAPL